MFVLAALVLATLLLVGVVKVASRSSEAPESRTAQNKGSPAALAPLTERDHIRGNPQAPVLMVEYSDFECPFCKSLHRTMRRIMDEYGKQGQVAWVYRHFPIEQLHPEKATTEAIASECATEQGGNGMFWQFADRFFELTPSNNNTDLSVVLPQIVDELSLDQDVFVECMESGRHDAHIREDFDNAIAIGARGTPWTVIVTPDGARYPLTGGPPYAVVKRLIDLALSGEDLEALKTKQP